MAATGSGLSWVGSADRWATRCGGRPVAVRPLLLVVHKFMSTAELQTPLGRERLAACTFKVPVDGEMVSMCEVNATDIRRHLNARLAPLPLQATRSRKLVDSAG